MPHEEGNLNATNPGQNWKCYRLVTMSLLGIQRLPFCIYSDPPDPFLFPLVSFLRYRAQLRGNLQGSWTLSSSKITTLPCYLHTQE